METPTIVSLRLEPPPRYTYRAGQFALLRIGTDAGPDLRPLSLASAPRDDDLRFVTRRGPSPFKHALMALQPGDQVKVTRAMGSLHSDPTRPTVLVAAGVGVAPMLSMVRDAVGSRRVLPLRLLVSNRTEEEIPLRRELEDLATHHPDLGITWHVTSRHGRMTREQLRRQVEELPQAIFYVTGPADFVSDVVATLREAGVPRSRIRLLKQTLPFPPRRNS